VHLSVPPSIFLFTTPAPTDIHTLSLHDALPISPRRRPDPARRGLPRGGHPGRPVARRASRPAPRHTSEEDALRLRRALRLHPRLRASSAGWDRNPRAEVGAQEAEAAVVRLRRQP